MIHILLVSREKNAFEKLETAFSDNKITTEWTDKGQEALSRLTEKKIDLFITEEQLPDMTGRELIEKVLFKNAMMNCVVLSELAHDEFHEAYEGLGVLMQFPLVPDKEHVQKLLDHLNLIAQIASRTSKSKGE
ncbi:MULTISPECIES: response regulator [Desulfobacula]|uniref:Response regulator receiver region protein n=2 Tax=Desulfobacula TaxID=28222 RepID=K0N7E1_DESTT|nr:MULTISPECIES: response regulator [Desulfobacula]CCK79879.1 response regulator receiver region protein [Desulfobacula toluolica Tol2]SDU20070.1 Response regulator receiver domain-containing protein [Desulfobacula phenolica]